MQHFGNINNKATSLTKQDWALLATTSGFKFCLVAFYMIGLITMLKEMGFDLKQLSWFYLLGGIEMAKFHHFTVKLNAIASSVLGSLRLVMPFLANHFYCPIHVAFHTTATGFYTAYGGVCAIEPKQSIFSVVQR